MVSLQSLLCSPEPSDPQDAEVRPDPHLSWLAYGLRHHRHAQVAKVYIADRKQFESTARYWTEVTTPTPPTPLLTSLTP